MPKYPRHIVAAMAVVTNQEGLILLVKTLRREWGAARRTGRAGRGYRDGAQAGGPRGERL